jgi:hypothetical protein
MGNKTDKLAKLRARCIELKATLDRRLNENHEILIRIANVNYYIDRLQESRKDTSMQPTLKTNAVAAEILRYDYIDDIHSPNPSWMPSYSVPIFSPRET